MYTKWGNATITRLFYQMIDYEKIHRFITNVVFITCTLFVNTNLYVYKNSIVPDTNVDSKSMICHQMHIPVNLY